MSGDLENSIEFRCSNCNKRLKARVKLAGRRMRCPNCATEIRVPQVNGSVSDNNGSHTGNSSTVLNSAELNSAELNSAELNSAEGLSEASAIGNSKTDLGRELAPVSAVVQPVESASTKAPPKNSFDVDDLQLESLAISDLEDRQRASEEIREGKDTKRRLQQAAEKRRQEEFKPRNAPAADDEYNLLPAAPPPDAAQPYSMPRVPMLDDDLLPKLAPELLPKSNSATTSKSSPSSAAPAKPTAAKPVAVQPAAAKPTAAKPENFDNLDALVPELDDVPVANNSLAFFEDVVEDKYRIACPICGTIQYVSVSERGSTTKCSDCYSKYTVPPPPAHWTPSKIAARHNNFDTESPLASDQDKRVVDRHRKQATNELLEKAEIDLEHEKEDSDRYGVEDFDTAKFMRRTFGFLMDPVALGFIFGYSLVFALVFAMVQYGISHSDDGEVGKGSALFCIIVGPLIGLLFGLPMISAALAQLEAVANHQAKVVDWPGFDMFDNIGDLFCVATSLAMSAIPGFLIGYWLGGDAEGSGRIQLAGVMFSVLLLFPIFLLSILDNGSLLQIVSKDVLRSMREVTEAWAGYYFKSALFMAVTAVLWFLLLGKGKSAILGAIAGASLPVVVFFLFQQVGSLADLIGGQLSFTFAKEDEEAKEDKPEDLEDLV